MSLEIDIENISEEKQPSETLTIERLRQSINLTNLEIKEIVHCYQKFVGVTSGLNQSAVAKICGDRPKQGLVYLMEAEKILEYGANCGKNISRQMITVVLHNQACCYQKIWQLDKCSNYLEALIFNINSYLKACPPSPALKCCSHISSQQLEGKPVTFRLQLCRYELQFCAINSQLRRHKLALESGRRAASIIKQIFSELHSLLLTSDASLLQNESETQHRQKMYVVAGITSMHTVPDTTRLADYEISAQHFLRLWEAKKQTMTDDNIKRLLKEVTIGTVMQLKAMSLEEIRESTIDHDDLEAESLSYIDGMSKFNCLPQVYYNTLLLSMAYFTIATELRLIAYHKLPHDQNGRHKSEEFKQSRIYHLMAIITVCIYVPYDTLYLKHLLTSYQNHYSCTLTSESKLILDKDSTIMQKDFGISPQQQKRPKKTTHLITSSLEVDIADSIRIGPAMQINSNKHLSKDKKHQFFSKSRNEEGSKNRNKSKGRAQSESGSGSLKRTTQRTLNKLKTSKQKIKSKLNQKGKDQRKNKMTSERKTFNKKQHKSKSQATKTVTGNKAKPNLKPSNPQQKPSQYYTSHNRVSAKSSKQIRRPNKRMKTEEQSKEGLKRAGDQDRRGCVKQKHEDYYF